MLKVYNTKMPHRINNPQNIPRENKETGASFYGLGIAPKILEILERIKFKIPTPIQLKAIPLALTGKDVVGIAQTGTGKTHAFAIPIVQRLAVENGKALIFAPTRELAMQIDEAFRGLTHAFGMHTACLIGGALMNPQIQALRKRPRVIISTPGRFIDHIWQGNIATDDVLILVLDEADRMLDMGFAPQIEQILKLMPRERQTMLFSATMPKEIMAIASQHMKLPISVEIAPSGTTAENITQELFIVRRDAKLKLLGKLLNQYRGAVLLFSRTKHEARKITAALKDMGHRAAEIHSDRSLSQRCQALEGFKSGRYKILVATDIAARGIDVTGIEVVINYDIPQDSENYVHRIGRTARAGNKGHAISFATPDQKQDVENIEKIIKATLPVSKYPEIASEQYSDHPRQQFRGWRPRRPSGQKPNRFR